MIIVCCQFIVGLDATVVNIALPHIRSALHFSSSSLAWVSSAYTIAFGGLLLLGGRAGDILGRRRVFMAALGIFGVASLLGGLAPSSGWLLAARAAQGAASAFAAPNALALITSNFEEGPTRNRAFGAVSGAYAASLALGLILGGMLTEWASWRWVMFINVPISVAVLLLVPLFINEAERHPGRFDLPGAFLSVAAMTSLVYGLLHAASDGWSNWVTEGTLALAVILLAGFIVVEARADQPIVPLGIFKNRSRGAGYFDLLALTATMAGMNFFVTQLLQNGLDFGPLRAGFAFLPMAFAIMTGGTIAAQFLERVGTRVFVVVGAAMVFCGMVWLSRVDLSTSYLNGVLGPTLLFGAGSGLAFTALSSVTLSNLRPEESGAGSSLLEAMQWVGFSLGVSTLVTVFASSSRHAQEHLPTDLAPGDVGRYSLFEGMSGAFTASLVFVGAALLVAIIALRTRATASQEAVPAKYPVETPADSTAAG
ncbi:MULTISPECIES: MFS transporter [Frankia]|nr:MULTISPECIES: MFS transporter [Frankia]